MKNQTPLYVVLLAFTSLLMASCIDEDSTLESILEQDKEAIADYLAANPIDSEKEFIDPETGFGVYWQVVSNSGLAPVAGDTVRANYTGKLLNNVIFDTSIDSVARANNIFQENRDYSPIRFLLGRRSLIEGFEAAVSLMESGDKATVIMPSLYGYGSASQGVIPANSPLIFEIDVIDFKRGPQP